jgi:hypothetical protein
MSSLPLLAFSHLRWDFVYQRPQHLLSRFAQRQPVLVIEEPFMVRTRRRIGSDSRHVRG